MDINEVAEYMEVSDRWSYNPVKKELVFFWWKCIDESGTGYKAKAWLNVGLLEFLKIAKANWKRYRVLWFLDDWQFELERCQED